MNLPIPASLKKRPRILNLLHAAGLFEPFSDTKENELACLTRHAAGARCAVEIGTALGVSAVRIAQAMAAEGRLFCVDPYPADNPVAQIATRQMRRLELAERITFLRGRSAEMAARIPRDCDFFFVDGDHSFEGLRTDWEIVLAHLAPGGKVCFHDTTVPPEEPNRRPGSVQYFHEQIRPHPEFVWLECCHTLNVMQRRSRA